MFFFKQNIERIQQINYMMEKCKISIKDLSVELKQDEKSIKRAMSGSVKKRYLLDEIENYLIDILKREEIKKREELAKKSLPELYELLEITRAGQSNYDVMTINHVIINYYSLEYLSIRNKGDVG
ncbi:hypothetical protein [Faecalibacillus intestinalis]|uniref:hypothetical protein n=1 Tax=Faecalibacillus intestinalis TaxID=1982626 RepID=UPI0022E990B1|nr:hypothetical protein [Faecalibacillus intestinalis]